MQAKQVRDKATLPTILKRLAKLEREQKNAQIEARGKLDEIGRQGRQLEATLGAALRKILGKNNSEQIMKAPIIMHSTEDRESLA